MKKVLIMIGLVINFACQGTSYNWYSGTLEDAMSVAGSKLIMLKFYTYT